MTIPALNKISFIPCKRDKMSFSGNSSCKKPLTVQKDTFVRSSKPANKVGFGEHENPEGVKLPVEQVEQILAETKEKLFAEPDARAKVEIFISAVDKITEIEHKFREDIKGIHKEGSESRHFVNDMQHETGRPKNAIYMHLAKNSHVGIPLPPDFNEICDAGFASIVEIHKRYQKLIDMGLVDGSKALPDVFKLAMESVEQESKAKEQKLSISGAENLSRVEPDLFSREMYAVFSNIIGNAVKYTPEKGKIDVDFSIAENDNGRPVLNFVVQDTGIGIPKDQQEDILKGKRARNVGNISGTGYGLKRINRLLKNCESKMKIESAEGKGTKITCPIPVKLLAPERQIQPEQ